MLFINSPLNSKCQGWYLVLVVSILNILSIVHDLNGLDAYTSCTVHKQDSVVLRHKRTNYTRTSACALYST